MSIRTYTVHEVCQVFEIKPSKLKAAIWTGVLDPTDLPPQKPFALSRYSQTWLDAARVIHLATPRILVTAVYGITVF